MSCQRSSLRVIAILLSVLVRAPHAVADTSSPATTTPADGWSVHPRFVFEVQYPLELGISGGLWFWVPRDPWSWQGLVIDAEVGGRGNALHLGFGASGARHLGWEGFWSYGVQGVVLRSSSSNRWLSPSTLYTGAEVFCHVAYFRASLGYLVTLDTGASSVGSILAGFGVGLP